MPLVLDRRLNSPLDDFQLADLTGRAFSIEPTQTKCSTGGSRAFDGTTSNYFSRADDAIFDAGDIGFFVCCSFYAGDTTGTQYLVTKYQITGDQREYAIYLADSALTFLVSSDGTAGAEATVAESITIAANRWYIVLAGHDPTADIIFCTASATGRQTAAHTAGIHVGTSDFSLGIRQGPASAFNGRLARVAIFKPTAAGLTDWATLQTAMFNGGNSLTYGEYQENLTSQERVDFNAVAWYTLNEATGNATDAVGSLDLTETGTVTSAVGPAVMVVSDKSGSDNYAVASSSMDVTNWTHGDTTRPTSLEFDGAADLITLKTAITVSGPFTFSAWINNNGTTGDAILGGTATIRRTNILVRVVLGGTNDFTVPAMTNGAWYHLIVTRDSSDDVRAYIDNVESSTGALNDTGDVAFIDEVGADDGTVHWDGKLDEIRYYSALLTADNRTWLFTEGASGTDPGAGDLDLHYDFKGQDLPQNQNVVDGDTVQAVVDSISAGRILVQSDITKQPTWQSPGLISGEPALRSDGTNDLLVLSETEVFATHTSGLLVCVFHYPDTIAADAVIFSIEDEAVTNKHFRLYIATADKKINLWNQGTVNNTLRLDTTATVPDTNYALVLQSTGSAYFAWLNGTSQSFTMTTGTDDGAWIDNVDTDTDNLTLFASKNSGGEGNFLKGDISLLEFFSDDNNASIQDVNDYLSDRYL